MSGETNRLLVPDEIVMSKIYHFRNQKVMLDMDLAILYQVETRALKQAFKRNILRFPDDFMFQLTKQEWQEVITVCDNLQQTAKYSPATPFAFTEQSLAMLSSVLNSERAIHVNIQSCAYLHASSKCLWITQKFVLEIEKLKNKLDNQDKNMEIVFRYLDELLEKQDQPNTPRKRIGYKPDDF